MNKIILKSVEAESTTTEGLKELKKTLLDCYEMRIELKNKIIKAKSNLVSATILQILCCLLIFGFFVRWFKENKNQIKKHCLDLENELEKCYVNVDMELDQPIEKSFTTLFEKYKQVITSQKIWDITSASSVDQKATRSAASISVEVRQVKFSFKNIEFIKSKYDALHFENANGGDLYIYPAFIVIIDSQKRFGLVDIRELEFSFHRQEFIETRPVPNDAQIVGNTWAKVNKNGTPDKRFKANYQIPICLYGEFSLKSNTGLNEAYAISSYEKAENFANAVEQYQRTINKKD